MHFCGLVTINMKCTSKNILNRIAGATHNKKKDFKVLVLFLLSTEKSLKKGKLLNEERGKMANSNVDEDCKVVTVLNSLQFLMKFKFLKDN